MELAEIGDRLFGRTLRLRVAAWVLSHDEESFFQSEAASGVGYTASGVAEELARLADLGMVDRMERLPGGNRQYYTKLRSPLWNVIQAAVAAAGEGASDVSAPQT